MSEKPFFVGYLPVPRGLRRFLPAIAAALVGAFAGVALAVSATQDDPGEGGVFGREDVTGVVIEDGYPILWVTEGSERLPAGSTVVLSALNKSGVEDRVDDHYGRLADVSGLYTARGDLAMLQLRGGANGVSEAMGAPPPVPEREALGRWRLTGELCDGKCYPGAMRPGRGVSHKACANLCIYGGVPPVFVLVEPFEGAGYLLVTDADGAPVGPDILDLSAIFISVEGEVERLGELLIFRMEPATAEVL